MPWSVDISRDEKKGTIHWKQPKNKRKKNQIYIFYITFETSKSQLSTKIYKENIANNKVPKTSEKTSNPRKPK